jgi:hypothetical protein
MQELPMKVKTTVFHAELKDLPLDEFFKIVTETPGLGRPKTEAMAATQHVPFDPNEPNTLGEIAIYYADASGAQSYYVSYHYEGGVVKFSQAMVVFAVGKTVFSDNCEARAPAYFQLKPNTRYKRTEVS